MKLTKKNLFKAVAIALPLTLSAAAILPIVVSCSSTSNNDSNQNTNTSKILTQDIVLQNLAIGGKWYAKDTISIDQTDDFTEIASNAFDGDKNINLKNLVTTINIKNNTSIKTIRREAFVNLPNLNLINLNGSAIVNIEAWAFNYVSKKETGLTFIFPQILSYHEYLEEVIFGNVYLKNVDFPIGSIYAGCLRGAQVESVKIPETVKHIANQGLWNTDSSFDAVSFIPISIETIGDNAFFIQKDTDLSRFVNLESIGLIELDNGDKYSPDYPAEPNIVFPESGKLKSIGRISMFDYFSGKPLTKERILKIPLSVTSLGKITVEYNKWKYPIGSGLITIQVPMSLKSIWTQEASGLRPEVYADIVNWY